MPRPHSTSPWLLFGVAARTVLAAAPGEYDDGSRWRGAMGKFPAHCVSLLQQRQFRSRFNDSGGDVDDDVLEETDPVPVGIPFYLKGAGDLEGWLCPESALAADSAGITLSVGREASVRRIRFTAVAAGTGQFYLRSKGNPEKSICAKRDNYGRSRLVWGSEAGRVRFALKWAQGKQFYLRRAEDANSYVRAERDATLDDSFLVFAPFAKGTSMQLTMEVEGATEPRDEPDEAPEDTADVAATCSSPLVGGKHSKLIPDSAITASSHNGEDGSINNKGGAGPDTNHGWGPEHSRIDKNASCWLSQASDLDQWIQWDFGALKKIQKIQTLGRPIAGKQGDNEWTSEYKLSYTKDGKEWTTLPEPFVGNQEHNIAVEHEFHPPLLASKMKLHPTAWISRIALRAEFFGCNSVETTPAPRAAVCGDCAMCEASPNVNQHADAAVKCPACAFGMLTSWPCNVTGICRCADNGAPARAKTIDASPPSRNPPCRKEEGDNPCEIRGDCRREVLPSGSQERALPMPAPVPRWVPAEPGQVIEPA